MAEIITVASGKGGVGKSSVTCGVASSLAKNGFKVLAADFDIGLRSLDLMLGVSEKVIFDWGDLLLGRCSRTQAVIDCGLDFLAAPQKFDEAFTVDAVAELFESVKDDYDFIFIDAPAGVAESFTLSCAPADRIFLVTTPDNVGVRSCSYAARLLRATGKHNIGLIINRFALKPVYKHRLLNIDDCIDASTVQLFGIVPEDPQVIYSSVLSRPPEDYSPSASAYERIAARLAGLKIPLVVE